MNYFYKVELSLDTKLDQQEVEYALNTACTSLEKDKVSVTYKIKYSCSSEE